jgi:hypothetical protein
MTKKSTVPEHIFFRVLEKSRKKTNKEIKEKQGKTLYEVFEELGELDEEDPNHRG